MATVLIVGNERESQLELAASLRTRRHSVLVSDYQALSLPTSSTSASGFEIAIFDVTSLTKEGKTILHRFCLGDLREKRAPRVLCYSRVNHGSKLELSMERLGVRFVYV
jgi:hypothetical protein